MNEPILRFAKPSDVDALVQLCKLHATYEKIEYDNTNTYVNLKKHLFTNPPSLFCLVVEGSKELIGYATYMQQFSTWDVEYYTYMDCLYLLETSRGFGIGEKLINRIKEEARNSGCTHIQWQTPVFNTRAINFYERIGAKSKPKERFFLEL